MGPETKNASTLTPGLYVVATPIGNLEDITLRALRILKEVDLIACEDTRHTQKLLNHYGITTRTISYHQHNEASRAEELVQQLNKGSRVALVTDAGMPGISDPGYRVIALAVEKEIPVVPIPGASAFVAALAASGLPTDSFEFRGFLPPKHGQRRQMLEKLKTSQQTQVFYEAPHRLRETIADAVEILGTDRPLVIAREVTKLHEDFLRGNAGRILAHLNAQPDVKGEITLLIGKADQSHVVAGDSPAMQTIAQRISQLMAEENLDEKAALKKVAKERGISKSEAYRELQRGR
jgi:16S rRNA (cytidine1402-2'-O)-methyltransferase